MPTKSAKAEKPKLAAKPKPIRPRDLLRATAFPIHPFDMQHQVDTSGLVPASHLITGHPHDEHVTAYYGVAPSILRSLIDRWLNETKPAAPIDRTTFIDIGAGKGRAMLIASQAPFREVLGVELNPALAVLAQKNIDHWTRHEPHLSSIRLLQEDATAFTFPPGACLIFMFHPFEAPVLRRFLRSIETQFARRPNKLDILYVNAECAATFDRHPAFTRLWEGPVPMSAADHVADLEAIAQQKEYGSTGDEQCAIYRYTGRSLKSKK